MQADLPGKEHLLDNGISFRSLTPQDSDTVLKMLVEEFKDQEPLSNSYYRQFPALIEERTDKWRQLWAPWINDAVTNGLSVGINKMIGVSVAKDLSYAPPNSVEYFNKMKADKDFRTGIFLIEDQLMEKVTDPELKKAMTTNAAKTLDIWGVAIDKEYLGRKLFLKMMKINQDLARAKGITKGCCYSVNYKTSRALVEVDFKMVAELDASKVDIGDGLYPFALIEEPHVFPSIWLKDL